jgi:hypothetical protein
MSFKNGILVLAFMGVAAAGAVVETVGLSDTTRAKRTLDDMGYTNVEYAGHPWFAQSKGDIFVDEFKAQPPGGKKQVDVVVTRGLFKGATIRVKD